MPRTLSLWASLLLLLGSTALAQAPAKRPLTHDDYDQWQSLRNQTVSRDGAWVAFVIRPQVGDSELVVRQTDGKTVYRQARGTSPSFSADSRFVVFTLSPPHAKQVAYELSRLKGGSGGETPAGRRGRGAAGRRFSQGFSRTPPSGEGGAGSSSRNERPKSKVALMDLSDGKISFLEESKSHRLTSEGRALLIYHLQKAPEEKKPEPKKGDEGEKGSEKTEAAKPAKEKPEGEKAVKEKPEGEKPIKETVEKETVEKETVEKETVTEEIIEEEVIQEKPAKAKQEKPAKAKQEKPAKSKTEISEEGQAPRRRRRPGAEGSRRGRFGGRFGRRGRRGRRSAEPEEKVPSYLQDGTPLVIRDLATGREERIEGVTSFGLDSDAGILWYSCNSKKKDAKIERGFFVMRLENGERVTLVNGASSISSVSTDRDGHRMVFFSNRREREKDKPRSDLYTWELASSKPAKMIISADKTPGFPQGYTLGRGGGGGGGRRFGRRGGFRGFGGGGLSFSRDASVLLFSASPLPKPELDKIRSSDKVTLDLWHWKDPSLQPMQARRRGAQSLRCAWHFDEERLVVLSERPGDSVSFLTPDGSRAIVRDSRPYRQLVSWDTSYTDISVVNTVTGARQRVLTKVRGSAIPSPNGRYLLVFEDGNWHACDLHDGVTANLTEKLGVSFAIEDWDTPQEARPYGIMGWTEGEAEVLVYDRHDIWRIKPDGSNAECITDGYGRAQKLSFRYSRLDRDERFIPGDKPLLLATTNQETMASGYYCDRLDVVRKPKKLLMMDKRVNGLRKAEDSDRLFLTLSTWEQSPDWWTCDADFSNLSRLSELNPQQDEIRWGKAELVRWRSADGIPLKGYLVKPEGFDPTKKYPMMVYFYEKTSSRVHNYVTPAPGTSPNAAYYVSNGYLWFQPDIVYREGYPGSSCLKCVVSGVQSLIAKGFVDEDAIGAAGHSWGGYQTAYLVTQTNIFKAVESGAPVSNMTSAYGGIRWGSGMSRAFQYEKTQSRIGGTLWQTPLRYIENSPIFFADKVETPVLMLHNDEDGAVPWYQGIEYFCALRRLGKEVYMFNYNGQGHGLGRRADQLDWTKRMQQYFDHHLRGQEMPKWMASGVPYAEREREKFEFNPPKHRVPAETEKPKTKPTAESPAAVTGER